MTRVDEYLDKAVKILEKLLGRLPRGLRRRLVDALEKYNDTLDPAMFYHTYSILSREYLGDTVSYEFPGFFKEYDGEKIKLPEPRALSGVDALVAIRNRRSRRRYSGKPLALEEVSTILYYATGITGWYTGWPLRAYPSAGDLQPAEVYLQASRVEGLEKALYYYDPKEHALVLLRKGDFSLELYRASLSQDWVLAAPANIILTAVYTRTASKYGSRSYRYIHLDLGTVIENIYIVAEALGLATVCVGAFYDDEVSYILKLPEYEIPIAIMPIGYRVVEETASAKKETIEEAAL